jgi:hypothetical protein
MNRNQIIQGIKTGDLKEAVLSDETILFPKRAFVIRAKKAGVNPLFHSSCKSVRPSTLERIITDIESGQYAFLAVTYDKQIKASVISFKQGE